MRADRLVSMLMLLQSRGRVPARELAETLGVSVRTIFRDMDALSSAGIPVYAERGVDGGCCLVEDYHTDLTGLNSEEARALFMLTAPGPLDSLEAGQKMRSALRKLAAALPGYLDSPEKARPRIHLDWTGWGRRAETGEQLGILYRAVQRQEQVRIFYLMWGGVEMEQLVSPLGLAAKTGEWHLAWLAHQKLHWQKVIDLKRVELTGIHFEYPAEFDLAAAWQENCADWEAHQALYPVLALALPDAIAELRRRSYVTVFPPDEPPAADGRQRVELGFSSLEAARQNLMGLGRAVEVLEPAPLRVAMLDYAQQILRMYSLGEPSRDH